MAYTAPTWVNDSNPAIDAAALQAISDTLAAAQALSGSAAPTNATTGNLGQRYIVTTPGANGTYPVYECVSASGTTYTWALCGMAAALSVTPAQIGAAPRFAPIITVTASRGLAQSDSGAFLRVNSTSAITITIASTASIPVGTEVEIFRGGTGSVTIKSSGVSFLIPGSSSGAVTADQTIAEVYSSVVLKQIDSNVWSIQGAVG